MLKKILIPHEQNEYKPHLFRRAGVLAVFAAIIVSFGITAFQSVILEKTNFLASIASAVLVDLTNADRAQSTLPGLVTNPTLIKAAQEKADDMAQHSYFAHTSPDGITPWHWFADVGYDYIYAGENLAIDFSDSAQVNQAWMNSPLHRANILNGGFTEIGIATAQGVYQGRQTTFVVQMFGKPVQQNLTASVATAPRTSNTSDVVQKPVVKTITQKAIASTTSVVAVVATTSAVLGETSVAKQASAISSIITSPSTTLRTILYILAGIVLVSLILMIIIEAARKHIKAMLVAIALLIILAALIYFFGKNPFIEVVIN